MCKAEVKVLIKNHAKSIRQEYWDDSEKGRHLYNIQKQVDKGRMEGRGWRDDNIITRLRIGHTGLNYTLKIIGKHPTGNCDYCSQLETVEHVLFHCKQYEDRRRNLCQSLSTVKNISFSLSGILGKASRHIYHLVLRFLKETGLAQRI